MLAALLLLACTAKHAPAPIAGHSDSPTPWPEDAIAGVHGWLVVGFGTEQSPSMWGPLTATQPTLLFGASWSPGTAVAGLAPAGRVPLTAEPAQTALYGCDGGFPVPDVAVVRGAWTTGMIWAVSPTFSDAEGLELTVDTTDTLREWAFGGHRVGLAKTGEFTATVWADSPDHVVATYNLAEGGMEGWEPEPFTTDSAFLVPQAEAAWRVGGSAVLGLYWDSFEGVHFAVLVITDSGAELHEVASLYRCAF